jgi:hypothetical protein
MQLRNGKYFAAVQVVMAPESDGIRVVVGKYGGRVIETVEIDLTLVANRFIATLLHE